jgi:putative component of membrane protein insertase Oxa1/YidC/SpoIIIJ protein YidD
MKYLILFAIKLYWISVSTSKRKKCLFKKSCSNYVFETTEGAGFINGIKAFCFRYKNCRGPIIIYKNPLNDTIQMILPSRTIIEQEEIAERLIK